MSDYVYIAEGVKLYIKGLKGFDSKESFIAFIDGNKEAGRMHKSIDANKAWNAVKKYIDIPEVKEDKPKRTRKKDSDNKD